MKDRKPWLASSSPSAGVLAACALLASCGAGTAGILAGSGDGGGGTAPALTGFQVENPKVSPARLRFESNANVTAELFFARPGAAEEPMMALDGATVNGNQVQLPAGASAVEWDFAAELGGTEYVPDVELRVRRTDGVLISGGSVQLGMGNDPPVVELVDPMPTDPSDPSESSGNVEVRLGVSDSSSDVVAITVEWRRASDAPDAWQPATAAGVFPGGVETDPDGVELSFFWNTNVDLAGGDDDVLLRVTADDGTLDADGTPIGVSAPLVSALLHVDNNEEPIVQMFTEQVISNPDERRGIPIPFKVFDEESDLVEVIFQWRREGEDFPALDADGDGALETAEIDAILSDPMLRTELQVCTSYPRYAEGRVVPIDEDTLRLPELASSASWILAQGIVGSTLELLRPSSLPSPISSTWSSNPLVNPIAAFPLGDGLTALVLDVPGGGRLREIELASGAIVREIATLGPGIPSAVAFERGEQAVLVATDHAGAWRIERVELATGAVSELAASDGSQPGPVRGIASLGTKAAVFTAGSSLLLLDYRDPLAVQRGTLVAGLASPWGIVVDPLAPDRVYVAERDADRVLAVELDSLGKVPVVVRTADLDFGTLASPTSLALERHGSRLLIVTGAPGEQALLGLDLGADGGNVSFAIGGSSPVEVAHVSAGPDGLRLLCRPATGELLATGGIETRSVIATHSTVTQDVVVGTPFVLLPRPGQPWRIEETDRPLRASAEGVTGRFLWDSSDAHGASVFLRAFARDTEIGLVADGAAPKSLRAPLEDEPLLLGGPGTTDYPLSVAAADLDGDGDVDLVSANRDGNNLTVFFQVSPGDFGSAPLVLGGSGTTDHPSSVIAVDLDGDGDHDLVSANSLSDNLTAFFQISPGSFSAAPLVIGGPGHPRSVAAADFDGDGDLDLVSANDDNLTVFLQVSPGSFSSTPIVIGGPGMPGAVSAADLDGDGDQDLVASIAGSLNVFFQVAPGSFSSAPLVLGIGLFSPSNMAADLDGDGDQDLVALTNDSLNVFFQVAPGSFSSSPLVLGAPSGLPTLSVAVADLDGDGDKDLVTSDDFGNLIVFFQLSPGRFSSAPLVLRSGGLTLTYSVIAADLDGDGDQDLVKASAYPGDLTVFFQASPGSFSSPPLVVVGTDVMQPWSVAAADLDGDGDQDLVSANGFGVGDNLTVFYQVSAGSFSSSPLELGGPDITIYPISVAAADLDGDGDQDLVSANYYGGTLTAFFQQSPGNFASAPLVIGEAHGATSVAAADLDGDGDRDIVSTTNFGELTIFFQLSPGRFSSSPLLLPLPGDNEVCSVIVADLDGDGDQDLVGTNGDLVVFYQVGPGSFSSSPLVLDGSGARSVDAADLDGDGDLDLVSANTLADNLTVFFQLSPGSFASSPLIVGGSGMTEAPNSVRAADFDGDGAMDLVSANADNLSVFRQVSPGRFSSVPLVLGGSATTSFPYSVVATDLDRDGDQDLVSANSGSFNLTVFWGGR